MRPRDFSAAKKRISQTKREKDLRRFALHFILFSLVCGKVCPVGRMELVRERRGPLPLLFFGSFVHPFSLGTLIKMHQKNKDHTRARLLCIHENSFFLCFKFALDVQYESARASKVVHTFVPCFPPVCLVYILLVLLAPYFPYCVHRNISKKQQRKRKYPYRLFAFLAICRSVPTPPPLRPSLGEKKSEANGRRQRRNKANGGEGRHVCFFLCSFRWTHGGKVSASLPLPLSPSPLSPFHPIFMLLAKETRINLSNFAHAKCQTKMNT